jgi:glucose-6-phosphate isomerase
MSLRVHLASKSINTSRADCSLAFLARKKRKIARLFSILAAMRVAPLAVLLATSAAATKSSPEALTPKHKQQRDRAIDALRHHVNEDVAHVHLRDLLEDEDRCMKCTAEACGVYLDFARQKVTVHTIDLLVNVARACNVEEKRDAMFRGEVMNPTEGRSVRHVSLRATRDDPYTIEEAQDTLDRVLDFARAVRCKRVRGSSGEALVDVVAIGIGGSSLGPACVHEALASEHASEADGRRLRFIANVDPVETEMALRDLDPASTLVIVISKTFTTKETMLNAALVKTWLGDQYETHMCAVTADNEKARAFGCERVFGFGDYVGGRYSVWSPVGCLPLALQYGVRPVREFLRGAREMDRHFRDAPLHKNLPVVLALVGFLNAFIYERDCRAVLPYARSLSLFPRYVQQLEMESNGKGVDVEGNALEAPAGEVVFGEAGTPGQHSFYQLLHQVRASRVSRGSIPPRYRPRGSRTRASAAAATRRRRAPSRRACANTFATTRGRAAPNAVAARVAYATAATRAGFEGRALRVPRSL